MAEPLSAIAAVVGLVEIAAKSCSRVVGLVSEWRDAPHQVQSLVQELLLSQQITKDLEAFCRRLEAQGQLEQTPQPYYGGVLQTSIERATLLWTELENIVRSVQKSDKRQIRKDKWLVRSRRVADLQEQLREIRNGIKDILNLHTA